MFRETKLLIQTYLSTSRNSVPRLGAKHSVKHKCSCAVYFKLFYVEKQVHVP